MRTQNCRELLLLLAVTTAVTAAPPESDNEKLAKVFRAAIRTEQGEVVQAPELQEAAAEHGVVLTAIHGLRMEEDSIVHVRQEVAELDESSERKLAAMTWDTRRDLVRLMMKLCTLSYTQSGSYAEPVLRPILAAGHSLYGSSVTDYTTEVNSQTQYFNSVKADVLATGNSTVADGGMGIDTAPSGSTGVHALEFKAAGLGTVLVFRGSYSTGDFDNIKGWITDWILSRMNAQLKRQWIDQAELVWTTQMASDHAQIDHDSRMLLAGGSWWYSSSFYDSMATLATNKGLDSAKARETGYWEFTKKIADVVRNSLSLGTNESFYITGHSQGGGRAALVSMYYEKRHNIKYETFTFAATGGLCFPRYLGSGDPMLTDVNPYIMHDQITEYVHVLDIYGGFDYDAGNVCLFGKTNIANTNAKAYCEVVFGHSGADLMVAGNLGLKEELDKEFKRCRYFTHSWGSMLKELTKDSVLNEDGTTADGCSMRAAIPQGDALCAENGITETDGCNDQRSSGTCYATSSSVLGVSCYWCSTSSLCRSFTATLFETCPNGGTWETQTVTSKASSKMSTRLGILGTGLLLLPAAVLSFTPV